MARHAACRQFSGIDTKPDREYNREISGTGTHGLRYCNTKAQGILQPTKESKVQNQYRFRDPRT